jgi:glutamine amidotransferase
MNVAIVKYNAGNIYSVVNALRRMGIEPLLTDDAEQLKKADRVLFPGQGQAAEAMEYLKARRLDEVIRDLKQPVFGICVGQQLLCKHSEEGDADCIGIFDAEVKRFQPKKHEDKVPCMGWQNLSNLKSSLMEGLGENPYVYFVHSYYARPSDAHHSAGLADYGGSFTAAIARDNIFATQFHPEKSAAHGLALYRNFLHWNP